MNTLALIVPCYNEQDVLSMFYTEVTKVTASFADRFSTELVFVDDGSSDNTLKIIEALAVNDPSVKYISFSRNFGKEAAMLAGMKYAVKADYIGIMDADLQHSPDLIPEMLKYVTEDGYDVAAARRSDREGESKLVSTLSNSFYKVINKISDTKISDSAQDFRIMKRDVVKAILSMPEKIRFSKGIFSWVGFNVKWIEHQNRERAAGQTKWSIKKLLKYAIDGILGFTSYPLRISFFGSAFFGLLTLVELIYCLIRNIVNELYVGFVPLILAGVFFVGCGVCLVIGIMGEYLARIYTEVKDRPQYIVAKTNTINRFLGTESE